MNPETFSSHQHPIRPEKIDKDALYALRKMQRAGFATYLVGGSVRDLLLGRQPKDFDISTSARPEEIRRLFSNCFLIGRRFRLAHLHFGKKIFEVSTFRAGDTEQEHLVTHDNTWGSPEEDAYRRDFTINGLFYDPSHNHIIDYVGGWKDLNRNLLRTIGKPVARFKQDPVRMIRALKFQARLGMELDQETNDAIDECRLELAKSSSARLLEELLRMMESGSSSPFFSLLIERQFFPLLLPSLQRHIKTHQPQFLACLRSADLFTAHEKKGHPDRGVLLANFLFAFLPKSATEQHVSAMLDKLLHKDTVGWTRKIATGAHQVLRDYLKITNSKRPKNAPGYEGHCLLQFLKMRAIETPKAADLLQDLHPNG